MSFPFLSLLNTVITLFSVASLSLSAIALARPALMPAMVEALYGAKERQPLSEQLGELLTMLLGFGVMLFVQFHSMAVLFFAAIVLLVTRDICTVRELEKQKKINRMAQPVDYFRGDHDDAGY